ncbi:MAG TPA: hypothetical protein V6C95_23485 [Coleofasciculaceae cyanobacterium]
MAAQRFSKIIEAAKLYPYLDNFIKWQTDATKRGTRVGQGQPRPASIKLYITPFAVPLPTGQLAEQSASAPAWNTYSSKFATYTTATRPATDANVIQVRDYTAPRVQIKTGIGSAGVVKTSAQTGRKYLSYGGTSTSIPFGKNAAGDTVEGVFADLRTQILGATPPANMRVTLIPEKS